MSISNYTGIVEREGDGFVSVCPELDVASQGETVEEALANLKEAVELFLECADSEEIRERTHSEFFITRFEVTHGESPGSLGKGSLSNIDAS